jgi:hypothetical protein
VGYLAAIALKAVAWVRQLSAEQETMTRHMEVDARREGDGFIVALDEGRSWMGKARSLRLKCDRSHCRQEYCCFKGDPSGSKHDPSNPYHFGFWILDFGFWIAKCLIGEGFSYQSAQSAI